EDDGPAAGQVEGWVVEVVRAGAPHADAILQVPPLLSLTAPGSPGRVPYPAAGERSPGPGGASHWGRFSQVIEAAGSNPIDTVRCRETSPDAGRLKGTSPCVSRPSCC